MKNSYQLLSFLLITSLLFLTACGDSATKTSSQKQETAIQSVSTNAPKTSINPPLEKVNVAYAKHAVNASKGETIQLKNGSNIVIPPNAFVDEKGDLIKGEVVVKYREFHDAAAIIASGIPMAYDTANTRGYFQTAGMFDIQGLCKNQPVQVAPNKKIAVNMASKVAGNEYSFYYFDEGANKWDFKGNNKVKEVTIPSNKKETATNTKKLPPKPVAPKKYNEEKFVFDFDVNYNKYPELKAFKTIMWQYAGNNSKMDPEQNEWAFEEEWVSIELKPYRPAANLYQLELSNSSKKFETIVSPALAGEEYKSAMANFQQQIKNYNTAFASIKKSANRQKQENTLIRSFAVERMGIYNWDVWKAPGRVQFAAIVEFDKPVSASARKVNFFLVSDDNRSVVPFNNKELQFFSFNPDANNKLIAILPGNKTAVYSQADFKRIDTKQLSTMSKPSYTLKLKTLNQVVSSVKDLEKILDKAI